MTEHRLTFFALVALIGIATPGPTVLLALSNGSQVGVRRSVPGMLGAMLSDVVLISFVAVGLGALLAASAFWYSSVKWAGIVYLGYLGFRLLRSKDKVSVQGHKALRRSASAPMIFLRSFVVAVTNPKGYLFFSAILPQFLAPHDPQPSQYAVLAVIFVTIDFVVMFAYASSGAQAVRFLEANGALWLDRVCGGVLLGLATSLALHRQR